MYNLVILAGVPGSGKSTWARKFFDLKYSIVSSDKIRKQLAGSLRAAHVQDLKPWDVFYNKIDTQLKHGINVIADATFLTRKHRERAIKVAWDNNAKCHLIVFKNVVDAYRRNTERGEDDRVPEDVMEDMTRLYWDTLYQIQTESYDSITKIESFV